MISFKYFLTEIERLNKNDYEGGKKDLVYHTPPTRGLKDLPGESGLRYAVESDSFEKIITIIDPKVANNKNKLSKKSFETPTEYLKRFDKMQAVGTVIGKLSLYKDPKFPINNSWQVGTITVDEDYRGKGVAKSLYGIALSILKLTLLAGDSQTPGGRKNWASLSTIPGVEIKGYAKIDDSDFDDNLAKDDVDKWMKTGGEYLGGKKYRSDKMHYLAFPVSSNGAELSPVIKKALNVYGSGTYDNGLYAQWTGK